MAEGGEQVPPLGEAEPPHHPSTPPISARVRNLFSGRNRNRSRSRDPDFIGRASESESQAGDEEEDENEGDWSVEDCMYRDFMESDPMGKVMLSIVKDNMALLKKAGIKESHVNIKNLCRTFFLNKHQQPTVNSLVEGSAKMVERMMLEKDLNTHKLNQGISPPAYFSPTPTLTTAASRVEAAKHFPSRKEKFTGKKGDGMNIVEFLSICNTAQTVLRLSEEEFLECLLGAVTGQAHAHMLSWLEQGEDVSSVYHLLALHYDNRLTALDARKQLSSYKIPKSTNLADGISHILDLATRASTSVPSGPTRVALYNLEAVQAILRALPPVSAATANTLYNTLSSKLGRGANATELTRALNMHRSNFDLDIRQNGFAYNGEKFKGNYGKTGKSKGGVQNVLSVTGTADSVSMPPPVLTDGLANTFSLDSKPKGQGKGGKSKGPKKNNKGSKTRSWAAQDGGAPLPYCSLCGDWTHKAAEGCRNMRDDQNKIVTVMPSHDTCNLCPMFVQPRLSHPPMYCPFRKGGIFFKNN